MCQKIIAPPYAGRGATPTEYKSWVKYIKAPQFMTKKKKKDEKKYV